MEIDPVAKCGLVGGMNDRTSEPLDKPGGATPESTRAHMTKLSGRGYAQLRHILVQLPDQGKPRASTLARMVSGRRHRELLLYLLVLTCWPWLQERRTPLPAGVWIRALTASGGPTWSETTLSRCWKRLEDLGLIEQRERVDRLVRVTPRREDAGEPYSFPGGRDDRWHTYFALPDEFWNKGVFAELSLPGLAVFLVVASETNGKQDCWFTYDRMDDWYGLKARTVQNGVKQLQDLGLLMVREEPIEAPLSATGMTTRMHYSLTGTFSYSARSKLQKTAQQETKARAKKKTSKVRMSPDPKKTRKKK